jgi:hypothetical protein
MHMKNESELETTDDAQPKKLLLGKKVLRHFKVRSAVQTGAADSAHTNEPTNSIRQRCFLPETYGFG